MPSIRILTRLSVVSLLGIQLFIETAAYPTLEKDKDIKSIEPRLFKPGGKSKPILGGALLAGGGILAYSHFKGDSKNPSVVIPSEPLSSRNGGPTDSPFLSDTASPGSTDLATGDSETDAGTATDTGTGALPGAESGAGVASGVGAGAGTGTGALPGAESGAGVASGVGAGAGTVAGTVPGAGVASGVGAGAGTVAGTVPGTVPATVAGTPQGAGAGVGTGTALVKKDIMRRGEYEALVPRAGSKGSAVKSGLGSVATVVVGSAVLNLFSGIVSGRKDRKAQQAANREAAGGKLKTEPGKNTLNKAKAKPLNTSVNESTLPSNYELKTRTRRPIEEDQTE